jgi:hypothetical protein
MVRETIDGLPGPNSLWWLLALVVLVFTYPVTLPLAAAYYAVKLVGRSVSHACPRGA